MGENICKWCDWQELNFQNIQTAHKTQQRENICKWCDWQGLNFQNIQIAHTTQQQQQQQQKPKTAQ